MSVYNQPDKVLEMHYSPGGGGGVLPYMNYIGMCGPKV